MFSDNQKISIRQIRRMLILDLFGISSLLLPGILAKTVGVDGVFCLIAAGILAIIYLWFLGNVINRIKGDYYSYLKHVTGNFWGDVIMIFYLFYFLLLAAFLLYQITGLVRAWLLPEGSYGGICFLILLVVAYATKGGIEGRARIYEIIFWFLGVPLLLILLLAARDVNTNYWAPIISTTPDNFFAGTIQVFLFFLPICFVLFLKPLCVKPRKLKQCAVRAVGVVVVMNIAIYLILLGIFQTKTITVLRRPVITLMSMVKLPGGFFTRLDAFMTAIWFFSLFALMNTGVFYSGHIIKQLFREKKTHFGLLAVLLLIFLSARWFHEYPGAGRIYGGYLKYIALPVLVLLPVLFCSGCGTGELENKSFPLAIGIDKNGKDMIVSLDLPDFVNSKEEKNPSAATGFSVEAGTYYEAQRAYENNTNKVLDYNHLKAIILSREFIEDSESLRNLLAWLEQESVVARNTFLFIAKEQSAEILTLTEGTGGSVGKYLEQMLKTQKDFKESKIMTIGHLMNQWHNQNELLLFPVLTDNGGIPSITEYAVIDAFSYLGNISVKDAMKSFLCRGMLKSFLYHLDSGEVMEIQNMKEKINITGQEEEAIVTIGLTGEAQIKKEGEEKTVSPGRLQKKLNRYLEEDLTETSERLKLLPGFDMSNSFIMLGGHERNLYRQYYGDYAGYREHLIINFSVNMNVVTE